MLSFRKNKTNLIFFSLFFILLCACNPEASLQASDTNADRDDLSKEEVVVIEREAGITIKPNESFITQDGMRCIRLLNTYTQNDGSITEDKSLICDVDGTSVSFDADTPYEKIRKPERVEQGDDWLTTETQEKVEKSSKRQEEVALNNTTDIVNFLDDPRTLYNQGKFVKTEEVDFGRFVDYSKVSGFEPIEGLACYGTREFPDYGFECTESSVQNFSKRQAYAIWSQLVSTIRRNAKSTDFRTNDDGTAIYFTWSRNSFWGRVFDSTQKRENT